MRNPSKAFTLIELLVVIAIIGILSSVVLASLSGARESARDARRQQDLRQIRTAIEMFYNDHGQYPPESSSGGWCTQISNPDYSAVKQDLQEYMPSVPQDPSFASTSKDYFYKLGSNAQTYGLYAELETENVDSDDIGGCARIDGENNEYDYKISSS